MTEETIIRSGWRRWPTGRARLAIVALTCSGAVLIAGCSSSGAGSAHKAPKPAGTSAAKESPSAQAAASASAAACVHINSLRTSLTSLTHVKVSATNASQLTTDLANIESQLSALKGQKLGAFSKQANELTAKVDTIKKDAAELSSSPSKAAMALNGDLSSLKTKSGPMIAEMKVVCHMT